RTRLLRSRPGWLFLSGGLAAPEPRAAAWVRVPRQASVLSCVRRRPHRLEVRTRLLRNRRGWLFLSGGLAAPAPPGRGTGSSPSSTFGAILRPASAPSSRG